MEQGQCYILPYLVISFALLDTKLNHDMQFLGLNIDSFSLQFTMVCRNPCERLSRWCVLSCCRVARIFCSICALSHILSRDKIAFSDILECCSTMIEAHRFINAQLNEERLPPLSYRISADYGMVEIVRSITSASDDLFGSTMNRCAKIN
jgi:hypothetical protein